MPDAVDKLRVISFESRRASEMESLIARHGGLGTSAPAMREVPLPATPEAVTLIEALADGTIDVLVLLTGVGTSALARAVAAEVPEPVFIERLRRTRLLARGPKPVAVLKKWGLVAEQVAAPPHTWREVVAALDAHFAPLAGRRIAVQEYGVANQKLYDVLASRGTSVLRVPVYRWMPPLDQEPLRAGLHGVAAGQYDVALFTSANQVFSVMAAAKAEGLGDAFAAGLARLVVASIGPVCSEALAAHDIRVDVEPALSKMGHLVKEVFDKAPRLRP